MTETTIPAWAFMALVAWSSFSAVALIVIFAGKIDEHRAKVRAERYELRREILEAVDMRIRMHLDICHGQNWDKKS